jgi:predicted nucleic acid-binding protein
MSNPRKVYWDTSCFICFLNKDEAARSLVCDDILRNADAGKIEIWISTWVIVEVIRPRRAGKEPLPPWAEKAIKAVPECKQQLEELWRRYQAGTPVKKLTAEQIEKIQAMFEWPFIKKMWVDEIVAQRSVEIARDYGLKPGDAVHAASAIIKKCDAIQRWDKDFDAIASLIPSEEPKRLTSQMALAGGNVYGPNPTDFDDKNDEVIAPTDTQKIAEKPKRQFNFDEFNPAPPAVPVTAAPAETKEVKSAVPAKPEIKPEPSASPTAEQPPKK